jgi:ubiquinone/menaquinone biosynthesis methyltransferase
MASIETILSNMANEFYNPGAQRAAQVNRLFAAIAPRYDFINDLQSLGLHRRWKRRLAEMAQVRMGDRALDLCCGTGDISFTLAQRGAEVTGLDFSKEMLAVAETRTPNSQATFRNPHFIQGDAQKIPFDNQSFDIITVGYGLRNLASWETGISEMVRVARPGARLLVLDFGKPEKSLVAGGLLRLPADLRADVRAAVLRQSQRLQLYPRIAEALPGATRGGSPDAGTGPEQHPRGKHSRRGDEH